MLDALLQSLQACEVSRRKTEQYVTYKGKKGKFVTLDVMIQNLGGAQNPQKVVSGVNAAKFSIQNQEVISEFLLKNKPNFPYKHVTFSLRCAH